MDFSAGIDWHTDTATGYRWDEGIRYFEKKFKHLVEVGEGSDFKVPWELSRWQFVIPLGEAYWLSGDEKYAREFVNIVNDWMEENPPYYGINWACAMEAGIRAANLIWGIYFFSLYIDRELFLRLVSLLERHGRFIWGNLEKWFEAAGNHYMANLAGLIYLGVFLRKKSWLDFGCRELFAEMEKQVLSDGVSFESSTSYHRLALELFFYPALLLGRNSIFLSESLQNRLKKNVCLYKALLKTRRSRSPDRG
jgi:hypothetical protein